MRGPGGARWCSSPWAHLSAAAPVLQVVKLFVFADRNAYDFVYAPLYPDSTISGKSSEPVEHSRVQDKESNKSHRFSHLDLFQTPSHCLPEAGSPSLPFWHLNPWFSLLLPAFRNSEDPAP